MTTSVDEGVIVPEVVGLPFHVGRDLASELGIALANPDPDGPPMGAVAWPGTFHITSQDPVAGTVISHGGSVRITVVKDGDTSSSVAAAPAAPAPMLTEHAEPAREPEEAIELSSKWREEGSGS